MKQEPSSPSFVDILLGQRKSKRTFLSQIDKIIDWTLQSVTSSRLLIPKATSPQGVPVTTALYCSRQSFFVLGMDSSDGEVEEQVNDRLSFSRFVGLGLDDSAPDSTTVCRFCRYPGIGKSL